MWHGSSSILMCLRDINWKLLILVKWIWVDIHCPDLRWSPSCSLMSVQYPITLLATHMAEFRVISWICRELFHSCLISSDMQSPEVSYPWRLYRKYPHTLTYCLAGFAFLGQKRHCHLITIIISRYLVLWTAFREFQYLFHCWVA